MSAVLEFKNLSYRRTLFSITDRYSSTVKEYDII